MKRVTSLTLVVLLCLALAPTARPEPLLRDTWTSVRSRNFHLVGNASERDIRQVATRLEQFREVFSRLFTRLRFDTLVPTTVIVFKNNSSYRPYMPLADGRRVDVGGYFLGGQDANYITLTAERRSESPYATIFHEYVHLLINNNMPHVPAWFNEGLAEFYSTFEVSDGDRKITIGRPIAHHVLLLRQRFMPLENLFAVDHASLERNERDRRSIFYAQSWALVHYLMMSNNSARRTQLGRFVDLLGTGAGVEEAFREAFQTDFRTLERDLQRYIERNSYPGHIYNFDQRLEFDAGLQSAPLAEADAQVFLGDLLQRQQRFDEAETHLRQALAADENHALANATLGMMRVRQRRFADARPALRRALAAAPQNHLAHYYYAYALSREGMDETSRVTQYRAEVVGEMRASLRKAIELAPQFPESYHLLGFINLVSGENLEEALTLLRRALTLSPGRSDYAFMLAQVHLRREEFDVARQILEPLAQREADPQLRMQARELLRAAAFMQEQAARIGARRSSSSSGAPPRLTPFSVGESQAQQEAGPPAPPPPPMDQPARPEIRRRTDGEQSRGTLTRLECGRDGVLLILRAEDNQTLRFRIGDMGRIEFITYVADLNGQITCGALNPARPVIITYRPSATSGRQQVAGEAIAVEFVPAEYDWVP